MAKRHVLRAGNWESLFGRLSELVLANSGEDEFEEIFKIVVAKLFSELHADGADFGGADDPAVVAQGFHRLLAKAADRWAGIIEGVPVSRLSDEHLAVCVREIEDYSIMDSGFEALDAAFEYLMSRASKGAKGQFFTPRHVIDCCVQMVNPRPEEVVLDPACGSGGFLVHALQAVAPDGGPERTSYATDKLWGFDFDGRAAQVAKALMLIAADSPANVLQLNSLSQPSKDMRMPLDPEVPRLVAEDVMRQRKVKGFDVILTNPPFAGEIKEDHVLASYDLAKAKSRVERDVLFIERCVRLLRPGGRMAIVLPFNKFAGSQYAYAREWLLRQTQIVGVVGLERNTFLPHTHQKAAVLFARKRERPVRAIPSEPIFFAVSEKSGKDSRGQVVERVDALDATLWHRADHDLGDVVTAFRKFLQDEKVSW